MKAKARTSPFRAVTYPASDATEFVVPVLACRLPCAGVERMRRRISSDSPATGIDAWKTDPQGALCAYASSCTMARAVSESASESPLPSATRMSPGRVPALPDRNPRSAASAADADPA